MMDKFFIAEIAQYPYFKEGFEDGCYGIEEHYLGNGEISFSIVRYVSNNEFFDDSLRIGKVIIKSIYRGPNTSIPWTRYKVQVEAEIVDSKNRTRKISLSYIDKNTRFSFVKIENALNYLNHFIDIFDDVYGLDELKLIKVLNNDTELPIWKSILQIVMDISMEEFLNSKYRAGKDNYFWTEVEMRNLPTEEYLLQAFFYILRNKVESFEKKDDAYIFYGYQDSAWRESYPRQRIGEGSMSNELRLYLAFELGKLFDENDRISYFLYSGEKALDIPFDKN